MVTAGSLPVTREATVNTITGLGAGGVSLGPLSEGPRWHSPWGSVVSPLQKKENNRQVQSASSLRRTFPIKVLSKRGNMRCSEALRFQGSPFYNSIEHFAFTLLPSTGQL